MSYCSSGVCVGCLFLLLTQITPISFYPPDWLIKGNLTSSKCAPDNSHIQRVPCWPVFLIRFQWLVSFVEKMGLYQEWNLGHTSIAPYLVKWLAILVSGFASVIIFSADFSNYGVGEGNRVQMQNQQIYSFYTDQEPKVRVFVCRTG